MSKIDANDERTIVNTFNNLIERADEDQRIFSKLLLTIYTPVTSGLVFLSTSLAFSNKLEKISFFIISMTGILIVFSALLENLGYFFISKNSAEVYTKYVRETGKHLNAPLGGKKWQTKIVELQVFAMATLLVVNLLSAACFIFLKINF